MSKVTIILTGVGICYLKDDKWKAILPFDKNDCHKVQFEYAGDYFPLNKADLKIGVTVKNGKNQAGNGTDFDKIFDLTGRDVHSKLSMKDGWENSAAILEIPNAIVSMKKPLLSKYYLKKGSNLIKDLGNFAFSIKAEIELEEDGEVTFNVAGNKNFPQTFKAAEGDYIIVINNNCFGNPDSETGDLEMLYDLVFDINKNEQFTIERKSTSLPKLEIMSSLKEILEPLGAKFPILSPLNHNPSDGEIGLPCYFTTASNPDGLP